MPRLYTSLPPEDVYTLTAEQKRPIEDADRRACIVISTQLWHLKFRCITISALLPIL